MSVMRRTVGIAFLICLLLVVGALALIWQIEKVLPALVRTAFNDSPFEIKELRIEHVGLREADVSLLVAQGELPDGHISVRARDARLSYSVREVLGAGKPRFAVSVEKLSLEVEKQQTGENTPEASPSNGSIPTERIQKVLRTLPLDSLSAKEVSAAVKEGEAVHALPFPISIQLNRSDGETIHGRFEMLGGYVEGSLHASVPDVLSVHFGGELDASKAALEMPFRGRLSFHGDAELSPEEVEVKKASLFGNALGWENTEAKEAAVSLREPVVVGETHQVPVEFTASGLRARALGGALGPFSARGEGAVSLGALRASFNIWPEEQMELGIRGRANFSFADLSGDITLEGEKLDAPAFLSIVPIQVPLALRSGELSFQGSMHIPAGKPSGHFELADGAADVGGALLQGIVLSGSFADARMLQMNRPGVLKISSVTKGVRVDDTSLSWLLLSGGKRVRVMGLQAKFLGGTLAVSDTEFLLGKYPMELQVEAKNLKLEELFRIYPQESIEGSGTFSAALPVTLNEGGKLSITGGELRSVEGGGVIRYRPQGGGALSGAAGSLEMTFGILENFHFDRLSADISYKPDGDLVSKVSLSGRNPDWQDGHPVNFNLTIEENIPALLRSLELADRVSEQIERDVRQKQKAVN